MISRLERILILCKTYPSPSTKHAETSCVAGIDETGKLIRLYPVPFRLIGDEQQFKKWQWITARVEKAPADHRPESHKIYVDTITCDPEPIPAGKAGWPIRRHWIDKIQIFSDFGEIERNRQSNGDTLALLRPSRVTRLEIKKADSPDWTDAEKTKLLQMQRQGYLFDAVEEGRNLKLLKKIPFDFYYNYECDVNGETVSYRHKLVDWEIGALYWNVRRQHGEAWEAPFRAKLEDDLPSKDLMLLFGTIHRFPDQWLIVSVIYPPKRLPEEVNQAHLF